MKSRLFIFPMFWKKKVKEEKIIPMSAFNSIVVLDQEPIETIKVFDEIAK